MKSNLPTQSITRGSDADVQKFFNRYFTDELQFPATDVDAVVTFFEKRGFDKSAAVAVGSTLLEQAKIDNVKVFQLLDTLKGLDEVQISVIVSEILNYNRLSTSTLGFKRAENTDKFERRNIRA